MTSALTKPRYKSYQEYLDDPSLSPNGNYRLLSTGELIEVASEDDLNLIIARALDFVLSQLENGALWKRIRTNSKEIQVQPVGDMCVNRRPDLMVLQPEHLEIARQAILIDMPPPLFVAEVVRPGSENSDSYKQDCVWKRQQYELLGIAEYWIIDPHREKVTVLSLVNEKYQESIYPASQRVISDTFPSLDVSVQKLLKGDP